MRKYLPIAIIVLCFAYLAAGFLPPRNATAYHLNDFGQIPVQFGTRVLPLDSVARNTLRLFSERTEINAQASEQFPEGLHMPAIQWFLELAMRPDVAASLPVFRVTHDEVLGLLGQKAADTDGSRMKHTGSQLLSFRDMVSHLDDIDKAAKAADEKRTNEEPLSTFDTEIIRVRDNVVLFQRLAVSFVPPGGEPVKDWQAWQSSIKPGTDALRAMDDKKPFDQTVLDAFALQAKQYKDFMETSTVGILPPKSPGSWLNLGQAALDALGTGRVSSVLFDYAAIASALQQNDAGAFNTAVDTLQHELGAPGASPAVHFEAFLNNLEPFFRGAWFYIIAFLCACISWVAWGPELRRVAVWLVVFALVLQTLGLFARVYLTGFGVVTSLYSAMLFNGWIGVVAGLIIELWKKNSVGIAASAFVGFATLIVAHSLPFNGDDLELPRAVLATNFWLWTHVTTINIGCGGMFVAGALGAGYLIAATFSKGMTPARGRDVARLVYGVTCFATLFSFVGTMLGGIWADQSWGRFWGWDPKENGALMIVLWCAICLHTRWGKLVSDRKQMALAVGGNMVTAWTLFGVNLLGVGLHSYGFMQGTFVALIAFWISQLAIISLAFLPERNLQKTSSNASAIITPNSRRQDLPA